MELARRLSELRGDLQFRFVSYGTGARTLEQFGYPLIDVGLPEKNGSAEAMVVAGKLIAWLRPDIVIAMRSCRSSCCEDFRRAAVFITDWFADRGHMCTARTFSLAHLHLHLRLFADRAPRKVRNRASPSVNRQSRALVVA